MSLASFSSSGISQLLPLTSEERGEEDGAGLCLRDLLYLAACAGK